MRAITDKLFKSDIPKATKSSKVRRKYRFLRVDLSYNDQFSDEDVLNRTQPRPRTKEQSAREDLMVARPAYPKPKTAFGG